jgi:hypothetical protein
MNPVCPVCGLYELNDGSEDTLYTCECESDEPILCDKCHADIDGDIYWEAQGLIYCRECLPKDAERIGERQ